MITIRDDITEKFCQSAENYTEIMYTCVCLTLLFPFDALLLWFDIEYLFEAFEEVEKQGDDRDLDDEVSVTLVSQFLLSLFVVGVGDDVEYLMSTIKLC